MRRGGIGVEIPYRANQPANGLFDRRLYRERNRIERLINRLKQFRRIATRYEKRTANYLAMLRVPPSYSGSAVKDSATCNTVG